MQTVFAPPAEHGNIAQAEKQARIRLMQDFPSYASVCLRIRTKDQGIQPMILNRAQRYIQSRVDAQLEERGYVRAIVLKGRQQGCSTFIQARGYWRATCNPGYRCYILTHESEATGNLFEMTRRFHEHNHPLMKPEADSDSARGLSFGKLESGYKVGTAGARGTGRSQTIQFLHASEAAFWPHAEEHAAGVLQAVPRGGRNTEVYVESTANGVGNWFHAQWCAAQRGDSDFEAIFIPWFWQEEYREKPPADFVLDDDEIDYAEAYGLEDDQMYWRRRKIQTDFGGNVKFFAQEFPANDTEAFLVSVDDVFIPLQAVVSARNEREHVEPYGPLLLGVDPARFGDDRTSWALRQGRVVHWVRSKKHLDTMEVVGRTKKLIDEFRVDRCFVDVVGLGSGVVDRLHEMGYADRLTPVNGGEKPLDDSKYANKRAECWGEMRDWLDDWPCKLPDDDTLQNDLCSLTYKFDSKSRYVLEKKEDAKKRGVPSPDLADSLALTFAHPVAHDSMGSFEPDIV